MLALQSSLASKDPLEFSLKPIQEAPPTSKALEQGLRAKSASVYGGTAQGSLASKVKFCWHCEAVWPVKMNTFPEVILVKLALQYSLASKDESKLALLYSLASKEVALQLQFGQ